MSLLTQSLQKAASILLPQADSRKTAPLPLFSIFSGTQGVGHSFKPQQSIEVYGDNVWLFRAVNTIANEYAKLMQAMYVERINVKGEIEVITEHGALDLLRTPMSAGKGRTLLSNFQMHKLIAKHCLLTGEAMLLMRERNGIGLPTSFFPLIPHLVEVVPDSDGFPLEYIYRVHGVSYTYPAADVIHFKDPDPVNYLRGFANTKPIRYALDQHIESEVLNLNRLKNRAMPEGVLETTQAVADTVAEKILNQFKKLYGGSSNAGKIAMLPNGLKFNKTQDSNAEMQFKELKDDSRDEVLASLGVGLEMLGKTDSQTRSNADAAFYSFMKFAVAPFVESMMDTWTTDYLHVVFTDKIGRVRMNIPEYIPSDMDEKRKDNELLVKSGAKSPNELREDYGLDAAAEPEADDLYMPMGMVPISSKGINLDGFDAPEPNAN